MHTIDQFFKICHYGCLCSDTKQTRGMTILLVLYTI